MHCVLVAPHALEVVSFPLVLIILLGLFVVLLSHFFFVCSFFFFSFTLLHYFFHVLFLMRGWRRDFWVFEILVILSAVLNILTRILYLGSLSLLLVHIELVACIWLWGYLMKLISFGLIENTEPLLVVLKVLELGKRLSLWYLFINLV